MTKKLNRVLLTNDDGIDAPGLATLAEIAKELANEIWIVAPLQDQSGVGQCISMNDPVRCLPRGDKSWAISGTPSDCVIIALTHLMAANPPDLILSGINAGLNTGDDCNMSGTLGAAYTALALRKPCIAISQGYHSRADIPWSTSRSALPALLPQLIAQGWDSECCLSVNLPADAPKGTEWTRPAAHTLKNFRVENRKDLRDKEYFWIYPQSDRENAAAGTDLDAIHRGFVSVSALTLDRGADEAVTDRKTKIA